MTQTLTVEYLDPLEGFKGWLVLDSLHYRLSAGGMRVQSGLTRNHVAQMAQNMTRKMRLADLAVDGAKCGIDYDPSSPGKNEAVLRFLAAIKPYIASRYSMGPDLNVDMAELEQAAARLDLPSVKIAIARAQGWDTAYFLERSNILQARVGDFTLGQLRAGYGVAAATLGTIAMLGIAPREAKVCLQGFGTLGKAALFGLAEAGCQVIAISDARQTLVSQTALGLPPEILLRSKSHLLPPAESIPQASSQPRDAIYGLSADLLIPAAVENTVTPQVATVLKVKAVVPGANLAVTEDSSHLLHQNGVLVIPDFLAGCGGSLSMEGLYGPQNHPTASQVLHHVSSRMRKLVTEVVERSQQEHCTPTEAALDLIASRPLNINRRPYEITP